MFACVLRKETASASHEKEVLLRRRVQLGSRWGSNTSRNFEPTSSHGAASNSIIASNAFKKVTAKSKTYPKDWSSMISKKKTAQFYKYITYNPIRCSDSKTLRG